MQQDSGIKIRGAARNRNGGAITGADQEYRINWSNYSRELHGKVNFRTSSGYFSIQSSHFPTSSTHFSSQSRHFSSLCGRFSNRF